MENTVSAPVAALCNDPHIPPEIWIAEIIPRLTQWDRDNCRAVNRAWYRECSKYRWSLVLSPKHFPRLQAILQRFKPITLNFDSCSSLITAHVVPGLPFSYAVAWLDELNLSDAIVDASFLTVLPHMKVLRSLKMENASLSPRVQSHTPLRFPVTLQGLTIGRSWTVDADSFSQLPNLAFLGINLAQSWPIGVLASLAQTLRGLRLTGMDAGDGRHEDLSTLTNLEELKLTCCDDVTDATLSPLQQLRRLTLEFVNQTHLPHDEVLAECFKSLSGLETLAITDVCDRSYSPIDYTYLAHCSALQSLDVGRARSVQLSDLQKLLPQLSHLYLSCDTVASKEILNGLREMHRAKRTQQQVVVYDPNSMYVPAAHRNKPLERFTFDVV